ncbi:MAG: helix-turn-helix domain-containing protein, partial [Cytophagales bacterium]|nr:helix-turn-helix domain-containing protein [Cytophagales bacterium]
MGRKIGRMRELLGIRQDAVADKLGISQQTVSKIERSENVDDEMLSKMPKALGINVEAIKSFDEESIVYNIIQNNYEGATNNDGPYYHCTFNPIDKLMEAVEENK